MIVFAYGSLMWNPGFAYRASFPALVLGWQRRWCVRSTVHRGTPHAPGLVLGLVPGGSCVGIAYMVEKEHEEEVESYLHAREMSEDGYRKETIRILLPSGSPAEAVCYVASEPCSLDARNLEAAFRSAGKSGSNADYVRQAMAALHSLGVPDGWPKPCPGFPDGLSPSDFLRDLPLSEQTQGSSEAETMSLDFRQEQGLQHRHDAGAGWNGGKPLHV